MSSSLRALLYTEPLRGHGLDAGSLDHCVLHEVQPDRDGGLLGGLSCWELTSFFQAEHGEHALGTFDLSRNISVKVHNFSISNVKRIHSGKELIT